MNTDNLLIILDVLGENIKTLRNDKDTLTAYVKSIVSKVEEAKVNSAKSENSDKKEG